MRVKVKPQQRPQPQPQPRPDIEAWSRWGAVCGPLFQTFESIEGKGARRLAWYILANCQRTGDRLEPYESNLLENYLDSYGMRDISPADVRTAQISMKEAQEVIGSRNSKYSTSAVFAQFEEVGFLHLIASGTPGHSSLYVLGPFGHNITREAVPPSAMGHNITREAVPPEKGSTEAQGAQLRGLRDTVLGPKGHSLDVTTRANGDVSIPIHTNPHTATANDVCPKCGNGRLLGYMAALSDDSACDISKRMEVNDVGCPQCGYIARQARIAG